MIANRKLILEDGSCYEGIGFGSSDEKVLEIVFNTSMAGYQEILSDPSYTDQAIVMSYPLIGNYGIAEEDFESKMIGASALIVRDINDNPSNFRSTKSVPELLEEAGVPGIYGVDTRQLVRSIRDHGSRRCIITDASTSSETGVSKIKATTFQGLGRKGAKKKGIWSTHSHRDWGGWGFLRLRRLLLLLDDDLLLVRRRPE